MTDHQWGFATRAVHAGEPARSDHRRPGRADLPDDVVRLRGHPRRRRPVRAAEVRHDLQPHLQPDRQRLRGADGRARGRHRRGGHRIRPGGRVPDRRLPVRRRRPPRGLLQPLRRHDHAVRRHPPPAGHRDHVRAGRRPRRVRRRRHPPHEAAVQRGRGQPFRGRRRHRGARRRRPGPRSSARARRDDRLALAVPAHGVGGRGGPALGDEVHRRARHLDRRGRRRVGPLRLGQRPLPALHRAGALLRRSPLLGELRRVRLLHEAAGRAAARHRRLAQPVQRVPAAPGARDAAAPHGGARRATPRPWPRWLEDHPLVSLGALRRAALLPLPAAGAALPARRGRGRCSPSG